MLRIRFKAACFMERIISTGAYSKHTDWGVMQSFPKTKK
jgi:hypothetical protein